MRPSFKVFFFVVVVVVSVCVVYGEQLNEHHPHRHQHGQVLLRSRSRQFKRQVTNQYNRRRLVVSINDPGRSSEQWTVTVGGGGERNISLIQLDDSTCENCIMEVIFLCDVTYDADMYRSKCGHHSAKKKDKWLREIKLFKFLAQDRYLCLSPSKSLYTVATSNWNSLNEEEARNCLWYNRHETNVVAYSFNHPKRDWTCREDEVRQRAGAGRRAATGQTAAPTKRRHCRKLFLTSTMPKTGNNGVRRRTPILSVTENRTQIDSRTMSLSFMPYGETTDFNAQQPFHSDALAVATAPPPSPSSTAKKRSGKGRKLKSSTTTTTTTTTTVSDVINSDSNSNRGRSRRSVVAVRRWRTIDVAPASGSADGDGASSVSSSRQTETRPVAAVDAS